MRARRATRGRRAWRTPRRALHRRGLTLRRRFAYAAFRRRGGARAHLPSADIRSAPTRRENDMTESTSPPSGPDLALGIATDTLADGAMLAGRVGDDTVLLARRGSEFFAIGASCTHYSGPLAEGLVVGDTVRCPWHHAVFSLRTGEAMHA